MTPDLQRSPISRAAFERSRLRSGTRERTLVALSSLGEAFPRQLAVMVGITASRLKAIMHGHKPDYSEALALVPLGLAEERMTAHGRIYAITAAGRRKARQLAARSVRRERARVANLPVTFPGRVWPQPSADPSPGVATPVPDTSSFTWSVPLV